MTPEQLRGLREGDQIQSTLTHLIYLVTRTDGDRVTAVQVVDVIHPEEWTLVSKARYAQGVHREPTP